MAHNSLLIHSASCLRLVFLYEYADGSLHLLPVDGVGLWRLHLDQLTLPTRVLDGSAPSDRYDLRADN